MADGHQTFDTKRLRELDLDGIVISVMTDAEQGLSFHPPDSPSKHQVLPGVIAISRVGREHKCNWPESDCNFFWHGPRACMLEANGFIALANGADFAYVCKKWQIPPPSNPSAPRGTDPARATSSQVAHEYQTEITRPIPEQRPADQPLPSNESKAKVEIKDGLGNTASPTMQYAPLSEDQRS